MRYVLGCWRGGPVSPGPSPSVQWLTGAGEILAPRPARDRMTALFLRVRESLKKYFGGLMEAETKPRVMTVEMWPITRILPYEMNARKIPRSAVDKVAASLKEYGWRQPIVVDAAGVIIVGHVRRLAALQNGCTDAPVRVTSDLTIEQIKAFGSWTIARR